MTATPAADSAAAKQNPDQKTSLRSAQHAPIPRRFTAGFVSADVQNSLWNHVGRTSIPMRFSSRSNFISEEE
jgi:hypothetical protein